MIDRVKQSTEQRHNTISDRISRERVEPLALPQSLFSPVLRQITHHALRLIHKEYEKALHPTEISPCSGYYRQALGLPCAHDLLDFLRIGKPLSVELFDRHWHKDALTTDTDVIGVLAPFKVERIRGRTPKNRRNKISKRYPLAFEAAEALFRAETRRCSQCGKAGHNKRTCFTREE